MAVNICVDSDETGTCAIAEVGEPIEAELNGIPMKAITYSTRHHLSNYLDVNCVVLSNSGYLPNCIGLAELLGFDSGYVNGLTNSLCPTSPTIRILNDWSMIAKEDATVGKLILCLRKLPRLDLLEKFQHLFQRDIESWKKSVLPRLCSASCPFDPQSVDDNLISRDVFNDTGVQVYDVFLSFNANSETDCAHMMQMARPLEAEGLTVAKGCFDLLLGLTEYEAYARAISHRCRHVVLLITKTFLESQECRFMMNSALARDPVGWLGRKVIPVYLEDVPKPATIAHINSCAFFKKHLRDLIWPQFVKSLRQTH